MSEDKTEEEFIPLDQLGAWPVETWMQKRIKELMKKELEEMEKQDGRRK